MFICVCACTYCGLFGCLDSWTISCIILCVCVCVCVCVCSCWFVCFYLYYLHFMRINILIMYTMLLPIKTGQVLCVENADIILSSLGTSMILQASLLLCEHCMSLWIVFCRLFSALIVFIAFACDDYSLWATITSILILCRFCQTLCDFMSFYVVGICAATYSSVLLLWSPYVIGQTIIFLPCYSYLLLSIFFLFLA